MELIQQQIDLQNLPQSTINALEQMKSERSQNGKARKYRQLICFGQSTERELDEMEKQITRIDKTAMKKASKMSNVNKSVSF